MALASDAQLLLLDEPMAGLGPTETKEMIALLKRLKGQIASCRQADLQLELTFRRGAVAAQGAKLE